MDVANHIFLDDSGYQHAGGRLDVPASVPYASRDEQHAEDHDDIMTIVHGRDAYRTQLFVFGDVANIASSKVSHPDPQNAPSATDHLKALSDTEGKLTDHKLRLESELRQVNKGLAKITSARDAITVRASEQYRKDSHNNSAFPFRLLPTEVRIIIYKMVVSRTDYRLWHRTPRRSVPRYLRFLLACKLFHNEAVDITFQRLKFWITWMGPDESDTSVTDQFRANIGRLPAAKRLYVRTIQVPLNNFSITHYHTIRSDLGVRYLKEIMARVSSPVDDHGLPNVDTVEFFHLRSGRTTRKLQFTLVRTAVTEEVKGVQSRVWNVQFAEGCMDRLRRSKVLGGDRYLEPVRG